MDMQEGFSLPPSPKCDDKGNDEHEDEVHVGEGIKEPHVERLFRLFSRSEEFSYLRHGENLVLSMRGRLQNIRQVVACRVFCHMGPVLPEPALCYVIDDPLVGNVCGPSVFPIKLAEALKVTGSIIHRRDKRLLLP